MSKRGMGDDHVKVPSATTSARGKAVPLERAVARGGETVTQSMLGEEDSAPGLRDLAVRFVLIGMAAGWADAVVGPVARSMATSFGVGLGAIGLLSGTVFFGACVVATWLVPPSSARIGLGRMLRTGFVLELLGCAVSAVGPTYAFQLAARAVVGLGIGIVFVVGTALARELGGVRLIGLFGGAAGLGVGLSLAVGGAIAIDPHAWRDVFVVNGAVAVMGLVASPAAAPSPPTSHRHFRQIVSSLRHVTTWRVLAVFVASNSVPLVLAVWLSAFLTGPGGLTSWVAGLLGGFLFALQVLVRPLGGWLRSSSGRLFPAAGLAGAAGGMVLLSVDRSWAAALVAVTLIGVGFSLPYAAIVDRSARVVAGQPASALAHFQTWGNAVPMVVAPLVGIAFRDGAGRLAFACMGASVLAAAFASLGVFGTARSVVAPNQTRSETGPTL
jgi:MFS family permease